MIGTIPLCPLCHEWTLTEETRNGLWRSPATLAAFPVVPFEYRRNHNIAVYTGFDSPHSLAEWPLSNEAALPEIRRIGQFRHR